MPGIGAR